MGVRYNLMALYRDSDEHKRALEQAVRDAKSDNWFTIPSAPCECPSNRFTFLVMALIVLAWLAGAFVGALLVALIL